MKNEIMILYRNIVERKRFVEVFNITNNNGDVFIFAQIERSYPLVFLGNGGVNLF